MCCTSPTKVAQKAPAKGPLLFPPLFQPLTVLQMRHLLQHLLFCVPGTVFSFRIPCSATKCSGPPLLSGLLLPSLPPSPGARHPGGRRRAVARVGGHGTPNNSAPSHPPSLHLASYLAKENICTTPSITTRLLYATDDTLLRSLCFYTNTFPPLPTYSPPAPGAEHQLCAWATKTQLSDNYPQRTRSTETTTVQQTTIPLSPLFEQLLQHNC